MTLWKVDFTLEDLNRRGQNTMASTLGMEFIEIGPNFLKARMPVDTRTVQPIGIMHGGASCALAETVGSTAANVAVDIKTHYCVGLDINTNHLRAIREGWVYATAKAFHVGKSTQVWGIEITNEAAELISVTRLTMAVLARH